MLLATNFAVRGFGMDANAIIVLMDIGRLSC